MNPTLPLAATAALCALPLAAFAQDANNDLSYTYLEVDYVNLDIDAFDDDEDLIEDFDDGSGWAAQGSFAFTENFFIFASYSSTDADASFVDDDNFLITEEQDVERIDAGLGVNLPVNILARDMDFVGRVAYVDVDYGDFDFGGSDDPDLDDLDDDGSDGWAADVRLRSQMSDRLEGSLGVGYLDIEDVDGFSIIGNLLIELTPSWGIDLGANVGDEVSTYFAGVRYSFNRF